MTSLIDCLGNTKVLSREVESKLTTIIRKGLDMETAIAAREAKLKRPLSVPEVVSLLVSPNKPDAHARVPENIWIYQQLPDKEFSWAAQGSGVALWSYS